MERVDIFLKQEEQIETGNKVDDMFKRINNLQNKTRSLVENMSDKGQADAMENILGDISKILICLFEERFNSDIPF